MASVHRNSRKSPSSNEDPAQPKVNKRVELFLKVDLLKRRKKQARDIPGSPVIKSPHLKKKKIRLVIISVTGEMDVTGERCPRGFYCVGNILFLKLNDGAHIRVFILL